MIRTVIAVALLPAASGHGNIVHPPTWFDPDGTIGMTKGLQCIAGCTGKSAPGQIEKTQGCACEWYTNHTFHTGEPTIDLDSPLVTYPSIQDKSLFRDGKTPWWAPGTAMVFSPCGIDGGNPNGCQPDTPRGGNCAAGGYGHGPDARTLKGNTKPFPWKAGSVQEVAWGITANHGGGYSFRLCPLPAEGRMNLTEECFQKTVLDFVGDQSWVQWGPDSTLRESFQAVRTKNGTFPPGSHWTKVGIPACKSYGGGAPHITAVCTGPQFPSPVKTPSGRPIYGFGQNGIGETAFKFNIVEKVQVPANLQPGKYVLSFRWDCEQTAQVWNSCSDILITGDDVVV
jgi:hypothetical protein